MLDLLTALFGVYAPLLDPVTGQVIPGFSGVDWPWLAEVGLFALCLFCAFRILGVVLKK